MRQWIIAATFLSMMSGAAGAVPVLSSTFDTDLEGWTAFGSSGDFTHNPGGYLEFEDAEGDFSAILSPAKFNGDISAYIGGTFSFDLNEIRPTGGPTPGIFGRVLVQSTTTGQMTADLVATPPSTWTTYTIDLTPQGFGATPGSFAFIMSDVEHFRITLDSRNGAPSEIVGLDNVILAPAATTVVPLPAAGWALLVGLGGLVTLRRRG